MTSLASGMMPQGVREYHTGEPVRKRTAWVRQDTPGCTPLAGDESRRILDTGNIDVRDNYDIYEDEEGNLTIKLTHYATTGITTLTIGNEAIPLAKIDGAKPKLSEAKITATVKITNASDAELGDAMPHFEVTDLTQEA